MATLFGLRYDNLILNEYMIWYGKWIGMGKLQCWNYMEASPYLFSLAHRAHAVVENLDTEDPHPYFSGIQLLENWYGNGREWELRTNSHSSESPLSNCDDLQGISFFCKLSASSCVKLLYLVWLIWFEYLQTLRNGASLWHGHLFVIKKLLIWHVYSVSFILIFFLFCIVTETMLFS